jgi:hypothetical protein
MPEGEFTIPDTINYFECKHGDNRGTIRCDVGGNTVFIPWDGIVKNELDALMEAVEFHEKNVKL